MSVILNQDISATRPLVFRYAPNSLNLFYAFEGNKNVSDVFYRLTANGIGAHYDYAPFGATTRTHRDSSASFDIASLTPFRFSSEYYDSELDLVYYNYRHYSPSLGRFLSRDPIEEQGGLNLYAFVKNSPLSVIDILGKGYWDVYPNYDRHTTSEVWKLVGGHIYGYHLDAPNAYFNSCALRVSVSLVKHGKSISKSDGGVLNDNFKTYKKTTDPVSGQPIKPGTLLKGDGKYYIISASKMMAFLGKTFGPPTYTWKTVEKAREYRKCIENRNQTAFFADSGHAGMIRKGYQDPYFPQESSGKIWVI